MALIPAAPKSAQTLQDGYVTADGQTTGVAGFAQAASVSVDVSVSGFYSYEPSGGVSTPVADTDSVALYLEDSANDSSWAQLDTDTLTSDGTVTLTGANPREYVRVRWDLTGTKPQPHIVAVATATVNDVSAVTLANVMSAYGTPPEVPAIPTAQDVVDALVTLGLVTQAA